MKISVEISKKVGLCNYGSTSATVSIQAEVPDGVIEHPELLEGQVEDLQALARKLVDRDLADQLRHQPAATPTPDASHKPVVAPDRSYAHQAAPAPAPPAPPAPPAAALAPLPPTHVNGKAFDGVPTSGGALFKWAKDQESVYQMALMRYVNQWAKLQGFGYRMADWSQDQVQAAYAEAVRKLTQVSAGGQS